MNKLILLLIMMTIGLSFFAIVKADIIPSLTSAFTKITTASGIVYEVNVTKESITKPMLFFNSSSFNLLPAQRDGTKRYTINNIATLTEEYKLVKANSTKPNSTTGTTA